MLVAWIETGGKRSGIRWVYPSAILPVFNRRTVHKIEMMCLQEIDDSASKLAVSECETLEYFSINRVFK